MSTHSLSIQTGLESPVDEGRPQFPPLKLKPTLTPPETPKSGSCTPLKSPILEDGTTPSVFVHELEYELDEPNRKIAEYGRGAWCVVYKATAKLPTSEGRSTQLVAVKSPWRSDAGPIVKAEARILARLMATAGHDRHVVSFLGCLPDSRSIVMAAECPPLSTYIKERAVAARANFSTQTMRDPVITMPGWCDLATELICGLGWLHDKAGVVHGDIKPQNILLRSRCPDGAASSVFPYQAVFADFSSAHGASDVEALPTALTPPFAAPELLTLSAMTTASVTTAADVYSLALTLLAAAIGECLLLPSSTNKTQLLTMSKQGVVFEAAQNGSLRVPRRGLVETVLSPAVAKEPAERIHPAEWLKFLESKAKAA
ncbi:hypothetical protein VTN49DRAFT_7272 [Thermomyces lanuginosus]|uniref:uncharacterized protein n=1 Tax=Thermomyces lanuginosus TaxID=5541 RepID=UPI00374372F9